MTPLEAVRSFCQKENDDHRNLHTPWVSGGKVVATNGHALIMVPEELLPGHAFTTWSSSTHRPEPDINSAYSLTDAPPEPVSVSSFLEAIASVDAQEPKPLLYRTVPLPSLATSAKARGLSITIQSTSATLATAPAPS